MRLKHRLIVALTAALVAAQCAAATPATAQPPAPRAAAAATVLPSDDSTRMPRTAHDETVGDFDKKGYDERAVVENGRLDIYDPPSKGGKLLRSTPTDLRPVGPSNSDGRGGTLPLWQGGAMTDLAAAGRLSSVYLAWTPDALYMAGSTNVGAGAGSGFEYFHNWLYKLPPDGSCASRSCATAVGLLPFSIYAHSSPFIERTEGVTALAVGQVHGKTFVAVGASDTEVGAEDGAVVIDPTTLTAPSRIGTYPFSVRGGQIAGFQTSEPSQVAVTALAWDPSGDGTLVVGTSTPTHAISAAKVVVTPVNGIDTWRIDPSSYRYWSSDAGDDYSPSALSAAVTDRADGSPVAAFGMSDGSTKLWDPSATTANLLANAAGTGSATDPNAVDAVSFVHRSDGTTGLSDVVAVSSVGNQARVLRYSGATTLTAQPLQVKGGTTTDVGGIRLWYPGYKTGAVHITNNAYDPVTVSFASRPNAAYGCWFGPAVGDRAAFPSSSLRLDSRTVSPTYTIGGYTAGIGGDCAATDFTGQWAAYVVVAPVGRPANTTTAKLTVSRSGKLTATAVGGSLTVQAFQVSSTGSTLGSWELRINGAPPPQAPSLTLTGSQLDPAGTTLPVYRFDLAASTWTLPFSNPRRVSAVLDPYLVQEFPEGGHTWQDLGRLVPQGQPTRSTSGSVTLGPASFYWQKPTATTDASFRVVAQGGRVSNEVRLRDLAAPADATTVGQVSVCPVSGGSDCSGTAAPFANGLDQAPLRVQLRDGDNNVLPVSDPNYGRVYYRDDNDELVSGLIPMDGSGYVRVSPYPGEYSNDGSAGSIVRPSPTAPVGGRFAYLSTSSTNAQEIIAHVGGTDEHSLPIEIIGHEFTPSVVSGSQAASGFYTTGCSDYPGTTYCRLASPDTDASSGTEPGRPALFLTKDPSTGLPKMGLMFLTEAETALTSLPLQQVAGQPEHDVAATTLSVSNGEVTMNTTSGFQPGDAIDAWLVSHGTNFQARAVRVGGGN